MHFTSLLVLLVASLATGITLTYDPAFDQGSTSLSAVACSNGPHGLQTKGYTTFDSLPSFPNIGAVPAVEGWNSAKCGSCWQLTYIPADSSAKSRSIYLLAIDRGIGGYNTAKAAMNDLTNGHATDLGRVTVLAKEVDSSKCLM